MRPSRVVTAALLTTFSVAAGAASFDCSKAAKPLEKLICSDPALDAADTQMGELYKQTNASFPVKGFVTSTQKAFNAGYSTCLIDGRGKPQTGAAAVRQCLTSINGRIAELQAMAQARVYSNAKGKFTPEDVVILVYRANEQNRIRFWGSWMPDAYQPKAFPDGFICDIDEALMPVKGGFKTAQTDETVIQISEAAVKLSEYIMCSPRNGIAEDSYPRMR